MDKEYYNIKIGLPPSLSDKLYDEIIDQVIKTLAIQMEKIEELEKTINGQTSK